MTKHTHAPWLFGAETGPDSTRIETESGKIIGSIRTREITRWEKSNPVYEWSDEGHANARLIAAAPDLLGACLSALRALKDNLSPGCMDADAIAGLESAIVKATGQ